MSQKTTTTRSNSKSEDLTVIMLDIYAFVVKEYFGKSLPMELVNAAFGLVFANSPDNIPNVAVAKLVAEFKAAEAEKK